MLKVLQSFLFVKNAAIVSPLPKPPTTMSKIPMMMPNQRNSSSSFFGTVKTQGYIEFFYVFKNYFFRWNKKRTYCDFDSHHAKNLVLFHFRYHLRSCLYNKYCFCSRSVYSFHCCINCPAQSDDVPSSFSKVTVSFSLSKSGVTVFRSYCNFVNAITLSSFIFGDRFPSEQIIVTLSSEFNLNVVSVIKMLALIYEHRFSRISKSKRTQ